ncbi:MAG: hypothetical protein MK101_06585 [Phycisphaerales bacterium]|nr:hypothetical protein [Phycisphaerales bacterium]
MPPMSLSALLLSLAMAGSLLCRYTIRDVGFVFIGDPLVTSAGDELHRAIDGETMSAVGVDVDGGATRRALAQQLIESVAVILIIDEAPTGRLHEAAQGACRDLQDMSDALRLARPLDGPLQVQALDVDKDPAGAFALGWSPGDGPSAIVLFGRGRTAGGLLKGPDAHRTSMFDQLSLVAESCECDRARDWMHQRHLPLPWDEDLRMRATDHLGFDPASPRVRAEMDRILARGPGRSTEQPALAASPDPLHGYDEVLFLPAPEQSTEPSAIGEERPAQLEANVEKSGHDEPGFSTGLFWFIIVLGVVTLVAVGMHRMDPSSP